MSIGIGVVEFSRASLEIEVRSKIILTLFGLVSYHVNEHPKNLLAPPDVEPSNGRIILQREQIPIVTVLKLHRYCIYSTILLQINSKWKLTQKLQYSHLATGLRSRFSYYPGP